MSKGFTFGEKKTEYNPKLGREVEVWLSPKYIEARTKAIETLESEPFKDVLKESDFWILTGLTKSGKVAYNGLILSHNGCLKINDALPKEKRFKPSCMVLDKDGYGESLVYTYCNDTQGIFEVGEVSKGNCSNSYPYAMALKRCMDRVILKNCKLGYSGIYSDSEAEEFKTEPEDTAPDTKQDKPKETKPKETKEQKKETDPLPTPTVTIVEESPRKDLVVYCSKKGLKITEVAAIYKLNNNSEDKEFMRALEELKAKNGE